MTKKRSTDLVNKDTWTVSGLNINMKSIFWNRGIHMYTDLLKEN